MCREVEKLVMAERSEGRAEGRLEERISAIRAIMESLSVSIDEAMKLLKLSDSEKAAVRELIEQ